MTACARCRQKKRRCDQQLPSCRLCRLAGTDCVEYDTVAGRQVPRSYIPKLERRIAYLESMLRKNGIHDLRDESAEDPRLPSSTNLTPSSSVDLGPGPLPPGVTVDDTLHQIEQNLSPDSRSPVGKVVGLTRSEPAPDLSFSRILLAELMHSTSPSRPTTSEPTLTEAAIVQIPPDIGSNFDTSALSLPTKEIAQSLVKAYFRFASIAMPLLHQPTFEKKLDLIYSMPRIINLSKSHTDVNARIAVFFVLEVFAVALLIMQKQDPSRISIWLADRYHKTALSALNMASIPNDVEGIQALLLVAQYSYHHPTVWAAWRTVGAALRLAVELGLHEDVSTGLDFLALDTRRRTFWVAYAMDRNLSVGMSMPSCLSDGAISAQFPSDAEDQFITQDGIISTEISTVPRPKRLALHMLRYRQIQSELRHMLWEQLSPYANINFSEWQHQMRARIDNWYHSIPCGNNLGKFENSILQTFEATYNTALLHLYRPSHNNPSPPAQQAVHMTRAAIRMIQLYTVFFRQKQLTIYWQSIENIFSAGTALMSAYAQFSEVQELIDLRSLESLIHSCSSLLWGMVERFPSFQGKRDVFDTTASNFLEELNASPSRATISQGSFLPMNLPTSEQYIHEVATENVELSPLHFGGPSLMPHCPE
ncbi:fungal specific transcription factor domain-containing protein [Ilyonectria robusta]